MGDATRRIVVISPCTTAFALSKSIPLVLISAWSDGSITFLRPLSRQCNTDTERSASQWHQTTVGVESILNPDLSGAPSWDLLEALRLFPIP